MRKAIEKTHNTELFLDSRNAGLLLEAAREHRQSATVSLDLNLSRSEVEVLASDFRFGDALLRAADVHRIADAKRRAFRSAGGGVWEPLEVFAGCYYHLVPTLGAPTVEIDGVQMHRTSGTEPFEAARAFAEAIVRPGDRVLDTCGGLGYTAIHAARLGASEVVSTEVSEGVLALRRLNPWSRLESTLSIQLVEGDAFAHITRLPAGSFDAVLHDPPRYSLAPELYSDAFYLRLEGLLRPGGWLFHYTGAPYSRGSRAGGRDFVGEVARRLQSAGFQVELREDLQGFRFLRKRVRRR